MSIVKCVIPCRCDYISVPISMARDLALDYAENFSAYLVTVRGLDQFNVYMEHYHPLLNMNMRLDTLLKVARPDDVIRRFYSLIELRAREYQELANQDLQSHEQTTGVPTAASADSELLDLSRLEAQAVDNIFAKCHHVPNEEQMKSLQKDHSLRHSWRKA